MGGCLSIAACGGSVEPATRDASDAVESAPMRDAGATTRADASDPEREETAQDGGTVHDTGDLHDAGEAERDDAATPTGPLESFVYVGGWGSDYPLGVYALDRESGVLDKRGELKLGMNPSYITPSADGRFLYVAMEDWSGQAGVSVLSVDPSTGLVRKLEKEPLDGDGALVFTSLDPRGKHVLAADYNGGQVVVYPVEASGQLGKAVDTKPFAPPADGHEKSAQTHSVRVHPSGKWAYAPNKALNAIAQFRYDEASGQLTPQPAQAMLATQYAEPRHIAFSPDGALAFVVHESSNTLSVYRVGESGALTQVDEGTSTLPAGFQGASKGAHVLVHPSGKYVYASNRGHDSIAVFTVSRDAKLRLVQHAMTGGKTPRNFDVDREGTRLVVANQGSEKASDGSLVVFAIGADGKLTQKGAPIQGLTQPTAVSIITRPKR